MRAPIARCSVARIYNCEAREESSRTASVGSGAHPGKSERSGGRAARHAQTDPATLAPTRDRRRYTRPPGALAEAWRPPLFEPHLDVPADRRTPEAARPEDASVAQISLANATVRVPSKVIHARTVHSACIIASSSLREPSASSAKSMAPPKDHWPSFIRARGAQSRHPSHARTRPSSRRDLATKGTF
jgi:hypothetical protein